ncbi:MAG: methionine adenosyltransferase [Acidimicrobiia bacterium]|nr:methionine adenosyltransferase [Acidimicrobiia bacterium]MDH3463645.1 methionine adenosyltransferase [Acidimicrobiia bacterium]
MIPWYFTSESVTEGHPDKVADAISDSVLDAAIGLNPEARVACEVFVTTRLAVVGGEIGKLPDGDSIDVEAIVRETVAGIGYDGFDEGFSADTIEVLNRVNEQSPDIAERVDSVRGAGDQGLMFGFAVRETTELMPLPIQLAHRLAERLAEVRRTGKLDYLRPDGKTQVMVRYEGDRPVAIEKVLISSHHAPDRTVEDMREEVYNAVVAEVMSETLLDGDPDFIFNPSGRFIIGGPVADTGLTGRKIIVDTYGGYARHGGGAFSGKDATKVDRSAAYAARWAAKNLVAAGVADKIEIQVSYAIGDPSPFSIHVESFGTEHVDPVLIRKAVDEVFDFRPASIIAQLELTTPIFSRTAAYGHFGRPEFRWEQLDRVDDVKTAVGL